MPRPTEMPFASQGALVGGLHGARAAAGDHGEARLDQALPSRTPASYSGESAGVRAEPNTLIAGGSSASVPKPSMNSDWMRRTRQGSVWTQSEGPLESSSRWSVVLGLHLVPPPEDRAQALLLRRLLLALGVAGSHVRSLRSCPSFHLSVDLRGLRTRDVSMSAMKRRQHGHPADARQAVSQARRRFSARGICDDLHPLVHLVGESGLPGP